MPSQIMYEKGGKVNKNMKAVEEFARLLKLERGEVPIVAHEGEYVLNKEAVDSVGREFLDRINQAGQQLPRMEEGGSIGAAFGSGSMSDSAQRETRRVMLRRMNDNEFTELLNNPNRAQMSGFTPEEVQMEFQRRNPQQAPAGAAPHTIGDAEKDRFINPQIPSRGEQFINREQEGFRELGDFIVDAVTRQLPEQMRNLSTGITGAPAAFADFVERNNLTHNREAGMAGGLREIYPEQGPPPNRDPMEQYPPLHEEHYDQIPTPPVGPTPAPPTPSPVGPKVTPERKKAPTPSPTPAPPVPPAGVEEDTADIDPVQEPKRFFMRAAGTAMPLDWEKVNSMPAGEAFNYLQQVAHSQAPWHNVPLEALRGGSHVQPQQKLFLHLVDAYNVMHGIDSQKLHNKLKEKESDVTLRLQEFAVDRLAAEQPYWREMAALGYWKEINDTIVSEFKVMEVEATFPYLTMQLDAALDKLKADTAYTQARTEMMQGGVPVFETPEDLLKTSRQIHDYRERLTAMSRQAVQHAQEAFSRHQGTATAENFHRAHLRYMLLSGLLPPGTKYAEGVNNAYHQFGTGVGGKKSELNWPSEELWKDVMDEYVLRYANIFQVADEFLDRAGLGLSIHASRAENQDPQERFMPYVR